MRVEELSIPWDASYLEVVKALKQNNLAIRVDAGPNFDPNKLNAAFAFRAACALEQHRHTSRFAVRIEMGAKPTEWSAWHRCLQVIAAFYRQGCAPRECTIDLNGEIAPQNHLHDFQKQCRGVFGILPHEPAVSSWRGELLVIRPDWNDTLNSETRAKAVSLEKLLDDTSGGPRLPTRQWIPPHLERWPLPQRGGGAPTELHFAPLPAGARAARKLLHHG